MKSCTWSNDKVMVSFDVKSLFTRVPVDLAIEVLNYRLVNDSALPNRTKLTVDKMISSFEVNVSVNRLVALWDHYYR